MEPGLVERLRGALVGLAVGDALGTSVERQAPGSFEPLTDMVGGGPYKLQPGQWTDDTSMALCLGKSLVARGGFDAEDQMQRYCRWAGQGYLSATGHCFSIGQTVAAALRNYQRHCDPLAGSDDPHSAGNGSLMRLAPIPLYYHADAAACIRYAALSSRTTHAEARCLDACSYYAGLIWAALNGASRTELLQPSFTPAPNADFAVEWHPEIQAVASGSFKTRQPPAIRGSGFVVESLEAALWAFYHSEDFASGALLAANLGDDADTTAAIYGQLAGAYYGYSAIPQRWRDQLFDREAIVALADALGQRARR